MPLSRDLCSSFTVGHRTHWIQARLAWTHDAIGPAKLRYVEGKLLIVEVGDTMHRLYTHDAWEVAARVEAGEDLELLQYGVLAVWLPPPHGGRPYARRFVSVATDDTPCEPSF